MIFIAGSKYRYKTIGDGQFTCPRCGEATTYERQEGRQYLTLYFVPLVPVSKPHEIIRCTNCGATFDAADFVASTQKAKRPQTLAQLINGLEQMLAYGRPVEYVVGDLTSFGVEHKQAYRMIDNAIGTQRKTCPDCSLTYAATVDRCAECDTLLTDNQE